MARGNHESQTMNQMYGFEGEVKSKYSLQMAELFTEVYNWLPLCHCLNQRVLVGFIFLSPFSETKKFIQSTSTPGYAWRAIFA